MNVKDYFEDVARRKAWGSLYDGNLSANNYNFLTRRAEVMRLLGRDGIFERTIDVGCGTGDYAQVASAHQSSFHGIDFSPEMIRQAQQLVGNDSRHAVLVASGEHIPYRANTFDLVLAMGYIEYLRDPTVALKEIQRVLQPGGVLVIQSYQREIMGTLSRWIGRPLRFFYRRLFRRGVMQPSPSPDVIIQYSQRQLDNLLNGFGFVRSDYAFNNFYVYPARLRSIFPKLAIGLSEAITRWNSKALGILAVNYIGKYVLEEAGHEDKS